VRAVVPSGASPAASSQLQRGSRAAHVTAKAHVRPPGVPETPLVGSPRGMGSGTYATVWFGTGEARLPSLVSKDRSYKPMVKSSEGKRESDGAVVLVIAVRNAAGGKDPGFGHAGHGVNSCKDMAGTARSNHPDVHSPVVKVRKFQDRLWATAKQLPLPRCAVLDPRSGDFASGDSGAGLRGGCVTMLRRPSVSCVRANRMHSSKGGCWKRGNAVRSTAGPRSVR
jgi:hypothetical protein